MFNWIGFSASVHVKNSNSRLCILTVWLDLKNLSRSQLICLMNLDCSHCNFCWQHRCLGGLHLMKWKTHFEGLFDNIQFKSVFRIYNGNKYTRTIAIAVLLLYLYNYQMWTLRFVLCALMAIFQQHQKFANGQNTCEYIFLAAHKLIYILLKWILSNISCFPCI